MGGSDGAASLPAPPPPPAPASGPGSRVAPSEAELQKLIADEKQRRIGLDATVEDLAGAVGALSDEKVRLKEQLEAEMARSAEHVAELRAQLNRQREQEDDDVEEIQRLRNKNLVADRQALVIEACQKGDVDLGRLKLQLACRSTSLARFRKRSIPSTSSGRAIDGPLMERQLSNPCQTAD